MENMENSEKLGTFHVESLARDGLFKEEATWAKYIPGGYDPARTLKLEGRAMVNATLLLAGLAIMFFGYDSSVMSQVNTNEDYLRHMGTDSGSGRDAAAIGGLVSLWFGGFLIGALAVGALADRIGRLRTITLGCLWGLFGGALQASAQNITWMAFARVIGGIGCGHLNTVVPIWTSELADPRARGAFVATEFTLALTGATIVYWIEYACMRTTSLAFAWRFPVGLQVIFLLLIVGAIPFFPESPRHLAQTGRLDDARMVLRRNRIAAADGDVDRELAEIVAALRFEARSNESNGGGATSYWRMLTRRDNLHTRRRLLLGMGVQVMQKFTGIDFISTYAPEMFALAGYTGNKPSLLAGGNFFGYVASLALAIYLCDRVGRRRLMLIGSSLMCVVLIAGGVLSHEVIRLSDEGRHKTASACGAGVTTVLYLYTFLYGSTWLTTCWVYPTEIFPLASRAKGAAVATVAFSLAGGFINEIVPYLINGIGFWVFILFALINLVMLVPIYLFYIETANRHLEDLDYLFAHDSPFAWRAERDFAAMKQAEQAAAAEPLQETAEAETREDV
ncbi:low-affinity glucose transporter HXT3 [Niveomyces insectorum RCEF 264]|uniref:Low-affinity glucose transporter HXT3 n=1 Tax=Niveomyces insectorum RCEF 264 TaxID=1081102 RepID=A0A167TH77_9HYPO|nr:low-affinity glucose transporter HXT3 [Niveomyces insectorum RCEF 264]